MAKDDIKKIDEQIELLKREKGNDEAQSSESETVVREIVDPNDENHVINIDYIDSEVKESTKELKNLESLIDNEIQKEDNEMQKEDNEMQKEDNKSENKTDSSLESSSDVKKPEENKKKKKNNIVIFVIVGIVLILVIALIVFVLFTDRKNNNDVKDKNKETEEKAEKKLTKEDMIKLVDLYGTKLESEINNYYNANNKLPEFSTVNSLVKMDNEITCRIHEIYDDRKVYLNECMVDYVDVDHSYGVKQEIKEEVDNNNVKVYVGKEGNNVTLEKPDYIENYIVYSSNIDGIVKNLTLLGNSEYVYYYDENNKMHLYNYILEKKALYKVEYESIGLIKKYKENWEGMYSTTHVILENKGKYRVYSLKEGNATTDEYDTINYIEADKNKIVVIKDKKYALINYVTNNTLIPLKYDGIYSKGNYLVCTENGSGSIFDSDGNAYLSDKGDKGKFLTNGIIDNYVFYKDELYSVNGEVLCKFEDTNFTSYFYGEVINDKVVYYDPRSNNNQCYLYDISKKECSIVEQDKCHR